MELKSSRNYSTNHLKSKSHHLLFMASRAYETRCAPGLNMASTFGGITAHVFSASDMSESVPVTEKIVEENENIKIESIFTGSH